MNILDGIMLCLGYMLQMKITHGIWWIYPKEKSNGMYKWVFAIKVNLDGFVARKDLWLKDLLSLMGWIISTMTRANIAFVVSVVSQFMTSPMIKHWKALEQILCYLKVALGLGKLYSNHGDTRVCFANFGWAGSRIDRRPTRDYCVFVGRNLVLRRSKKQSVVLQSSAKSKYKAMAKSTCEKCGYITFQMKLV